VLVVAIGLLAGGARLWLHQQHPTNRSDFGQVWYAGATLLAGGNPYAVVGPGQPFDWEFPLLYPMPAIVVAAPLSVLPLRWAEALFLTVGFAAFVWAVTRHGSSPALCACASLSALWVLETVQWSPLITAAALIPSLGFLLACKPNIALALLAAYPSRRAMLGAAAFGLTTMVIWPWWPSAWLETFSAAPHIQAPVTRTGGPLLLLTLPLWRHADARLLLAMACVPHTPVLYEVIPLFLLARTLEQGAVLAVATVVTHRLVEPGLPLIEWFGRVGDVIFWLFYLPCLGLVIWNHRAELRQRIRSCMSRCRALRRPRSENARSYLKS
jgi:hypothetical protein